MKTTRQFPAFTVTKKAENALKNGHPWVYDAEITKSTDCENGDIVDIFSEKGSYLGSGFLSNSSKIRIRRLSDNANESFSEEFFRRRIKYALEYRLTVMKKEDLECCRLCFGEADGLPGFTVDRFNNILVTQVLSYGMEKIKDMLYANLISVLAEYGIAISGIFERNDVAIRELEGLTQYKGWYGDKHPESAKTVITENGIKYNVDVENGQKTGFFLDQKYNRLAAASLAEGKRVLDCFTHTGSFALNAVAGGAAHVTAVDVSASAIEMTRANAELNGMTDKMDFLCADVFDLLPKLCEEHASYDYIILDPPAFTKSGSTVNSAFRGYKEINRRAMHLLPRGGYLATCSCSHFMPEDLFCKMLKEAAHDAGVSLLQVEARQQAPDHPILWGVPETSYLKFYIF